MPLLIDDVVDNIANLTEKQGPKREGVLLTVEGQIAKVDKQNKNKRVYSRSLWEKVLKNPEIKAKIKTRSLYGEADHPQSFNANIKHVANVLTDMRLGNDGQLYGTIQNCYTP